MTLNVSQPANTGTGQFIGTPSANTSASYDGKSSDNYTAVFDGNTATFFDAPTANGNYVQLDLGSAKTITQIKYAPRAGNNFESRMVGGVFEVSNDPTFASGVVTLLTISSAPADGLTTANVSPSSTYRYVRYVASVGSYGNIAELQVFGPSGASSTPMPTPLAGTPSANTTASYDGQSSDKYTAAFDGNVNTFFDSPTANGNYIQLDLGATCNLTQIAYAPRANFESRMVGGHLRGIERPHLRQRRRHALHRHFHPARWLDHPSRDHPAVHIATSATLPPAVPTATLLSCRSSEPRQAHPCHRPARS